MIASGRRVIVLRLPQVHDARRQGRITWHIELAREKGWVAYVGEGQNRLPAVHVSDAVGLYRLALETGERAPATTPWPKRASHSARSP